MLPKSSNHTAVGAGDRAEAGGAIRSSSKEHFSKAPWNGGTDMIPRQGSGDSATQERREQGTEARARFELSRCENK